MLDAAAKDLRRLRQIWGVAAKYGFTPGGRRASEEPRAPAPPRAASTPAASAAASGAASGAQAEPTPRRFRRMLEELGPTFIKLGQVLSSRPDLVSPAFVAELKLLQAECTPLSFTEIRAAIEDGLGVSVAEAFASIDPEPLATASVAQVHAATTRDGQRVVVKVQRPGIREEIEDDVGVLYRLGRLFEAVVEEAAVADPVAVVREFEAAIHAELDFRTEARNAREFARLHAARPDIVVPGVHDALSCATVLTLDFLKGVPLSALPDGVDKKALAQRVLREGFDEVFLDGFFHGDPHPGNLLLLEDGRYGILDFGLCGRITPEMREMLGVLSLAVALRDADTAARALYRLGQGDARVSIAALRDELASLFARYLGRSIQDVDATMLLHELLSLAVRHKIRVPPEYSLLGRAGATIEGIVRSLDPEVDVSAVAAPYAERLLLERVGGGDLGGGLSRALLQFQGFSQDVPLQLSQLLADLSSGRFSIGLQAEPVDRLAGAIVTAAFAVSLSILGSAFVLGAFIALSGEHWEVLGVPVVAAFGAWMGFTIFGFVSAYVALRPRLKKLSLGALLKRRLGGRGGPTS